MGLVYRELQYEQHVTTVATTVPEVLKGRIGRLSGLRARADRALPGDSAASALRQRLHRPQADDGVEAADADARVDDSVAEIRGANGGPVTAEQAGGVRSRAVGRRVARLGRGVHADPRLAWLRPDEQPPGEHPPREDGDRAGLQRRAADPWDVPWACRGDAVGRGGRRRSLEREGAGVRDEAAGTAALRPRSRPRSEACSRVCSQACSRVGVR